MQNNVSRLLAKLGSWTQGRPEESDMRTTSILNAATLEKLIAAAVAAPSLHNTQPWRCRPDPDTATIEVRAATERSLRHTDPLGRALHVSVGAAVFNLRVAVAHFGWEPVVRLLPRPAEPGLLASVRLAGPLPGGSRHGQDLYDAVWRRHSSRVPFSGRAIPARVLAETAGRRTDSTRGPARAGAAPATADGYRPPPRPSPSCHRPAARPAR